jgi:hypothetical protein
MVVQFATATVDGAGGVGGSKAIAVDPDGVPHILYVCERDPTTGDLFLASRTAQGWVTEHLSGKLDSSTSLSFAIDPTGVYHLAFCQDQTSLPTYATRTASSPWVFETIPTGMAEPVARGLFLSVSSRIHSDHAPWVVFRTVFEGDQLSVAQRVGGRWTNYNVVGSALTDLEQSVQRFRLALDDSDTPFVDYFFETAVHGRMNPRKTLRTVFPVPNAVPGLDPVWTTSEPSGNFDAPGLGMPVRSMSTARGFVASLLAWSLGGQLKTWRSSGTGEPPVIDQISDSGVSTFDFQPAAALDRRELNYVAFCTPDGGLWVANYVVNGPNFGWVTQRVDQGGAPSMTISAKDNRIHVAYENEGSLMYATGVAV